MRYWRPRAYTMVRAVGLLRLSLGVWSPELENHGNSLAGIAMIEHLSQLLGRTIF